MSVFKFKQFSVDQAGCGMKINTDGVLLAALAQHPKPLSILDIGTGTGVIALMLAQRFADASIDAVEIDKEAAAAAHKNFKKSPFHARLRAYPLSFQDYFAGSQAKLDMIVSNPPFFLNALKNSDQQKHIARHTNIDFFYQMLAGTVAHLNNDGIFALILPAEISTRIIELADTFGLYLHTAIAVKSFKDYAEHRNILIFGFKKQIPTATCFVIYEREKEYSGQFSQALADFFIIFQDL